VTAQFAFSFSPVSSHSLLKNESEPVCPKGDICALRSAILLLGIPPILLLAAISARHRSRHRSLETNPAPTAAKNAELSGPSKK
jgi:hypothetical protein